MNPFPLETTTPVHEALSQLEPLVDAVWTQIAAIPAREIRTYGEVAKAIKNAPRAVGQACGANPYPLVVPCHRVVAAGGGLGGFGGSGGTGFLLDIKR